MTRTTGPVPAAGDSLTQALRTLPKVELHLHLEGTIRPRTVRELAAKYEPRSPLTAPDWHERYWTFTDLAGFVTQMRQVSLTCLRNPDDYYRLAAECFADLAAQHVCYAEVMFGFRGPEAPFPIPYPDLVAAIEQARREVEARSPLRIGLLPSLIRTQPDSAVPLVRQALAAQERGAAIVGIDLVGDEAAGQDFAALAPAFRLAGAAGLGLSAHAGEAAGPESCWGALRLLGARRLGHATRAGADSALLAQLRAERITLTMCPTSNLRTGAVSTLAVHPIRAFYRQGLAVTVNSDDPTHFGATLTDEYLLLARRLGFSFADLRQLTLNAVEGAFQPAAARAALRAEVERAWSAVLPA